MFVKSIDTRMWGFKKIDHFRMAINVDLGSPNIFPKIFSVGFIGR